MTKLTASILGVILIGTVVTACSSEDEKSEAKVSVTQTTTDSYDWRIKSSCKHFKRALANADITTYQEQLKELKDAYTGAAWAYENGVHQSGPLYYAMRTTLAAAVDNNFNDEAVAAMAEVAVLCSSVPN
jgi:hypothetical protein